MKRSFFRGHSIIWNDETGKWVYEDNGDRAGFRYEVRSCKKCGLMFEGSNIGDADPCLGELPGVDNACCGHGIIKDSYIRFSSGLVVKGFSIEYTERWKEGVER